MTKVKSSVSVTSLSVLSTMVMGWEYAPNSIWTAINAVTQVETSTRHQTEAKARSQFARGTFGVGANISKRAFSVAQDLLVSC